MTWTSNKANRVLGTLLKTVITLEESKLALVRTLDVRVSGQQVVERASVRQRQDLPQTRGLKIHQVFRKTESLNRFDTMYRVAEYPNDRSDGDYSYICLNPDAGEPVGRQRMPLGLLHATAPRRRFGGSATEDAQGRSGPPERG